MVSQPMKQGSLLFNTPKPEATSQAKAAGFNKVVVSHFYDNLRDIYEKFEIPQCDVWNGDETNVPTVMQPPDVIATKNFKQVSQTVSAERGAERGVNVMMLVFVNAIGSSTPPVFVFPRKKQNPDLIKGGPTGCLGLVHESGWMTAENFLLSLQHFHGIVKSTKEKPVLLTLDNHSSHIDYNVVKFAKDNGIILLTFPPQCSHALQPLDVSVFGPFKSALKKSHNQWLQDHPGQRISIKEVAHLCRVPYMEKVIPGNITPGFQKTGIYPFNRDVIPDTRYAPASVTDQPEIEQHATSDNVTEPRMTQDVISHPDGVFELEETREEVQISGDPATPTITLTDIRPLPKVSQTTPKARRSQKQVSRLGRTRILTNTPEINVIAEHHQRQSEKIEKSRRRLQPASEKINNKKGKQKIIIDMETTSNEDYSVKKKVNVTSTKAQSKKKVSLKQQNDSVSNDGDELIETPVISGEIRTRTGRLVKPSIYRSL
ncbi:uncharacterized protein LOC116930182 [Daphnia magna]|uniref:uncharacterized protein LOC116930182 n=1 Tax=Daphnia magna TaxID=35525 RepID=UPI001E1BBB6B|nr:uncharacterized protein LOC116930182 [Daphnia magna]